MKQFIKNLLDSQNSLSAKRFITLIISFHFIFASFVVLFFAFYVIIYMPKGKTDIDLLATLKMVLEYDFYIILAGLGFITGDSLAGILLEKAKVISAANVATGNPTATNMNVTNADVANIKNAVVNTNSVIASTTHSLEEVSRIDKPEDDQ